MELAIIKLKNSHLLKQMVFLVHVLAELFYVWECQVHDASSEVLLARMTTLNAIYLI